MTGRDEAMALLEIENLQVGFETDAGLLRAVDGVSLALDAGHTLGLVGESGCGKSVTAASVLRLVPSPPGVMLGGSIRFDGRDILTLTHDGLRQVRGREVAMVFQDPMTSLNPVFTIERQLWEVLALRFGMDRPAARVRTAEMLRTVGIAEPEARLGAYPHELSGGMKQRVMIAMALLCEPRLMIADEPTTALDVTVQAQIFDLLRDLRQQTGTSIILITHDMGAVAEMAERMIVMYAGRKAEIGPVEQIIEHARHPYTRGLISCVPHILSTVSEERHDLTEVPGIVPSLRDFGKDRCLFASRCAHVTNDCVTKRPPSRAFAEGHIADCWHAEAM